MEITCKQRVLNLLCGIQDKAADFEASRKLEEHLQKVSQLKQHPVARVFLNIGLVGILALGTFFYIFFSVWQYQPE